MDIPLIEQVKIQAQVLVPLVRVLQAELGEERANAIVRKALGDLYRKYGEKWWRKQGARDLGERWLQPSTGSRPATPWMRGDQTNSGCVRSKRHGMSLRDVL
jgi:hypothetical protein